MNQVKIIVISLALLVLLFNLDSRAQEKGWTLEACIDHALQKNIDVQQSILSIKKYELNLNQSKNNRLPSISASVSNNFTWEKNYNNESGKYGSLSESGNTSYGVSSGVTLFNGLKLKNQTEQASLNLQIGKFYSDKIKESLELNILNAYLQVLYAKEGVSNAEKQLEATSQSLILADERLNLGVISRSDYLQIKSQLASEKLTLANAISTLTMARVNLMQLMELPVNDTFDVSSPDIEKQLEKPVELNTLLVYQEALQIKPQIKEAELNVKGINLNEKIAKAGLLPSLSMNTGANTSWISKTNGYSYTEQLSNALKPYIGINLSIPIFQKNQAKTDIKLAKISSDNAILEETGIKNTLRKEIEQAVTDAKTAKTKYEASKEQNNAAKETYLVAEEKYNLGQLNSTDFLIVKNNLISSESSLLQTKYNMVFSNRIIDFYRGIPISLSQK